MADLIQPVKGMNDVLADQSPWWAKVESVAHALFAGYGYQRVYLPVLERTELASQLERYRTRSADERRSIPGLQPKRAEVILAGACIVASVMDALGADRLTVSDRGLRHGVLATRFGVTRTATEEPA